MGNSKLSSVYRFFLAAVSGIFAIPAIAGPERGFESLLVFARVVAEVGLVVGAGAACVYGATKLLSHNDNGRRDGSRPIPLPPPPPDDVSNDHPRFSAYYPHEISPGGSYRFLLYAYLEEASARVEADKKSILHLRESDYRSESRIAPEAVKQGAMITIEPRLDGCIFDPERGTIEWKGPWHRSAFSFKVMADVPRGCPVNGEVCLYLNGVVFATLEFSVDVTEEDSARSSARIFDTGQVELCGKVFLSYSHEDKDVVKLAKGFHNAFGHTTLMDSDDIRSGENWKPKVKELIEKADAVQLFWSTAAQKSCYVDLEWRHALTIEQNRQARAFLKPCYWEDSCPKIPQELSEKNFTHLPIGDWSRSARG